MKTIAQFTCGGLMISLLLWNVNYTEAASTDLHQAAFDAAGVVSLINQARSTHGLPPLKQNDQLDLAALLKTYHMVRYGYFSHYYPNAVDGLKAPWDFLSVAGYNYQTAGENLAKNYVSAHQTVDAMLNSAPHRANVLGTQYKEVGAAVIDTKQSVDRYYVVVFFASSF